MQTPTLRAVLKDNLVAPGAMSMKTLHFDDEKQDFEALLAGLKAHGAIAGDARP